MLEQWQIAAFVFGAFICVGIGYFIGCLDIKWRKEARDETENQVGGVL